VDDDNKTTTTSTTNRTLLTSSRPSNTVVACSSSFYPRIKPESDVTYNGELSSSITSCTFEVPALASPTATTIIEPVCTSVLSVDTRCISNPLTPIHSCNSPVVSSLQISSVSIIPRSISGSNTLNQSLANLDTPSSVVPALSTAVSSTVTFQVTKGITNHLSASTTSSTSTPSPVDELHSQVSRFNLTFGCLDDLLPQDDPTRSAYVHRKCAQLRYPLPLAIAMSKLIPSSKIPAIQLDSSNSLPSTSSKRSQFTRNRQPDYGFLEIDASHFSLGVPPNTPQIKPSTFSSVSTRPRTKAQLRVAAQPDMDIDNGPTTTEDRPAIPCSSESRKKGRRNLHPSRRHTVAARNHEDFLDNVLLRNSSQSLNVQDNLNERTCGSRSFGLALQPTAKRHPSQPQSISPQRQSPVILIEDDDQETRTQIGKSIEYAATRPDIEASRLTSATLLETLLSGDIILTGRSPKLVDSGVLILSSQDLAPALPGLDQHRPHWISLKFPSDSRPRSTCYLLLGDVSRVICLLLSESTQTVYLEPLFRHCQRRLQSVSLKYLHLRTPSTYLSLELLAMNNRWLGLDWTKANFSQRLFLVPWPSGALYDKALHLACLQVPAEAVWRTAVPHSLLLRTATLIEQGEFGQNISNCTNNTYPKSDVDSRRVTIQVTRPYSASASEIDRQTKLLRPISVMAATSYEVPPTRKPPTHLPPSIYRFLQHHNVLRDQELIGYETLTKCFRNIVQYLFVDIKSSIVPGISQRKKDMPTNLFTCIFDMHDSLSRCLRPLRDSYASLISAGSCLTARYKLAEVTLNNSDQLRIERGRARLFASELAARSNISRIFRQELCPPLNNLIDQLNAASDTLKQICSEENLMGPFASPAWRWHSRAQCEQSRHLVTTAISAAVLKSPTLFGSLNEFLRLSAHVYEVLDQKLSVCLRKLATEIQHFRAGLWATLRAMDSSWIPVYDQPYKAVDMRASEDLKFLTNSLQSQFDVFEAWLREQHNTVIPLIGSQLLELFHAIFKPGDGIENHWDWRLPNTRLFVPFGSKNSHEQDKVQTHVDGIAFHPLPNWPPAVQSVCKTSFSNVSQTVCESTQISVCSPSITNETPITDKCSLNQTSTSDTLATAGFADSTAESEQDTHTSAAKRICIYLTPTGDESASIRSCHAENNGQVEVPRDEHATYDRRRLGRLKRKMKISHTTIAHSKNSVSDQADRDNEEAPIEPERHADPEFNEHPVPLIASSHIELLEASSVGPDDDGDVQSHVVTPPPPDSDVPDDCTEPATDSGTNLTLFSSSDSATIQICAGSKLASDTLPNTVGSFIQKSVSNEVAKGFVQGDTLLTVNTSLPPDLLCPPSESVEMTIVSTETSERAPHSAPALLTSDPQETDDLVPSPEANRPLSAGFDTSITKVTNGTGILNINQVAADLSRLVPWLEQKAKSYQPPGPVTAAVLGQTTASISPISISIDLTTDD
ncbi:hypothetical protein P879_02780, partial [Paragonimus westermani]